MPTRLSKQPDRNTVANSSSHSLDICNSAVDNVSRIERSKQMSLVRSKSTKPEMLVRRLVHGMGYRYRLHQTELPGRPDLVFRSQRKVVFVHGCFWHGHKCRLGRMPKSRLEYWMPKITGNRERDVKTLRRLRGMRWRALVLWECQLHNLDALPDNISLPQVADTELTLFLYCRQSSGA
jgi:DNA mismatch endonuclease (patch repair protein)